MCVHIIYHTMSYHISHIISGKIRKEYDAIEADVWLRQLLSRQWSQATSADQLSFRGLTV
jgi:hypothetical protein